MCIAGRVHVKPLAGCVYVKLLAGCGYVKLLAAYTVGTAVVPILIRGISKGIPTIAVE